MSEYRLIVKRIDRHPQAGLRLPYDGVREYRPYSPTPDTYPDTVETQALEVVLSESEYAAVKLAVVEASR